MDIEKQQKHKYITMHCDKEKENDDEYELCTPKDHRTKTKQARITQKHNILSKWVKQSSGERNIP